MSLCTVSQVLYPILSTVSLISVSEYHYLIPYNIGNDIYPEYKPILPE